MQCLRMPRSTALALALGLLLGCGVVATNASAQVAAAPRYELMCANGDARGKGACPADAIRPAATMAAAAAPAITAPSPDGPTPVVRPTNLPTPAATELACVRDRTTGLVWLLDDALSNWDEATSRLAASANTSGRCGLRTGWRLPTRRELLGIVDIGRASPAIDTAGFPGARSDWYWSSDVHAASARAAWVVVFSSGTTDLHVKINNRRVRLVNGPAAAQTAMQVNPDGTVTDNASGLVWDRCEWGVSGAACDSGTAASLDWAAAQAAAKAANESRHKGFKDWRVPTRAELESLVRIDRANPAIDDTAFPKAGTAPVWSSSPSAAAPMTAWFVEFGGGGVVGLAQQYPARVRLVRGSGPRP